MKHTLQLAPIADLKRVIHEGDLVAFDVGPDSLVYLVVALGKTDYQYEAQDYRVAWLSGDHVVMDLAISGERFNIHSVQPLGPSELLLVCCRSRYRGRGDYDRNGRVYRLDGQFARELFLGDGIESVQTTSDGTIWTSYTDEGIFGNFGWKQPIGKSGLIAWNDQGQRQFAFQPIAPLDAMCDCYALNVESESSVWCYYYTQFPLVHIQRKKIKQFWNVRIGGSDGFAVSRGLALFRGGYDQHDNYTLLRLGTSQKVETLAEFDLIDESGEILIADRAVGRGESIHLLRDERIYRFDLCAATHVIGL